MSIYIYSRFLSNLFSRYVYFDFETSVWQILEDIERDHPEKVFHPFVSKVPLSLQNKNF